MFYSNKAPDLKEINKKMIAIQEGDDVEIIQNSYNALHPSSERPLEPGEVVKVAHIRKKRLRSDQPHIWMVLYERENGSYNYIPIINVEKVENCRCPQITLQSIGCICGIIVND